MFSKEDIDYYVQEVIENPESSWSTSNDQLAGEVFAEVKKVKPEAKIYRLRENSWIIQNEDQRKELLHKMENIWYKKARELEELWDFIRRIREDV